MFQNMERLNLQQGSTEWLNYRRTKISATDASIICGLNTYSSPEKLLRQKMGLLEVTVNDKMKLGTELEPEARELFNQIMNVDVKPAVVVSDEYPFAMSSLDGITDNDLIVVEFKCGKKAYQAAEIGHIPSYYKGQLQHTMMVCGLTNIFYAAYNGMELIILEEFRDNSFIEDLILQEIDFYDRLINLRI